MDKSNVIWLFGRKVKVVANDDAYTPCRGCELRDICENNLVGINECICSTSDGTRQKFIKDE